LALKVFGPAVRRLTRRTNTKWDDIVVEVIRLPLALLVIAYGAVSSLQILSLSPITIADLELTYAIALTLIASLLAYRILVKVVICYGKERCLDGKIETGGTLVNAISLLGKVVIPVAAIFVIAGILGMDLSNMILGVGFLGLVIGYATQNTLSNMFAGIQLLFDRPFRSGDRVPLNDGHTAQVLEVGLLTTKFVDMDTFEEVIVPNSLIESQVIINMNAPDARWKSSVKVRVPSDRDPKLVEDLMMEASRRTPQLLQGAQAPVVRLSEVKDGRMLLTIFIWIDDVMNRHLARTEYRRNLVKVFEESGMEFALPRSQVWLKRR
jgi:small-conductance mechanosensitive channel